MPEQNIRLVPIDKINIEPLLTEENLKFFEECFLDGECRKKTFESIPMIPGSECIVPSPEAKEFFDRRGTDLVSLRNQCCPDIDRGKYIKVKDIGGRFVVKDGNHRIQTLKNHGINKVLAIVVEDSVK